jgi:myo-inositol-1(or 4)-monophosphatase
MPILSIPSARLRRLGSCALHLAYVAVGRVAVGYESKFNAWDIAAGIQLVEGGGVDR